LFFVPKAKNKYDMKFKVQGFKEVNAESGKWRER